MRSRTESHLPGRCKRCYLREHLCVCASVPRVETRTEVLIVRHLLEARKSTNTARVAALALPRATIVDVEVPPPELIEELAARPGTVLLFPGATPAPAPPLEEIRRLVVVDGTWRQARRLARRLDPDLRLPRLAIAPPARPPLRLRRSPRLEDLSTLEAIAGAVRLLEGETPARALEALHRELVQRVLVGRGLLDRAREARERSA